MKNAVKRSSTLFFHDVLNEVGILSQYSENLRDGLVSSEDKPAEKMHQYSQRIIEFIQEQQDLLSAERGLYSVRAETFHVDPFLKDVIAFYEQHRLARQRKINFEVSPAEVFISTDKLALRRILGNLIKNAFEATALGQTVVVRFKEEAGRKIFSVHNAQVMPPSVQHQVFQRSFSTKGPGRGIGTYSIKLFAEQYLKGKVWFESEESRGTTFFVQL